MIISQEKCKDCGEGLRKEHSLSPALSFLICNNKKCGAKFVQDNFLGDIMRYTPEPKRRKDETDTAKKKDTASQAE